MKPLFVVLILAGTLRSASAQTSDALPLWPDGAPGALGHEPKDIPTLTPYVVPGDNKPAIVVCPGGGYGGLAPHEGHDYALWLNQQGVSAFVLKYRLGSAGYRHPAMIHDAQRAIRMVRARAAEWHIDSHRVGIMGSSAGGHLASTAITHYDAGDPNAKDPIDRESCRPDFGILCYAVITMGENTHKGSRRNLLGDNPDPKLIDYLSNEKQVTKDTPPCFIWHTWEDPVVKVENSLEFAAALRRAGVRFALHIYEKGGHGMGLHDKPPFNHVHPWAHDLVFWLKETGIIKE